MKNMAKGCHLYGGTQKVSRVTNTHGNLDVTFQPRLFTLASPSLSLFPL